VAKKKKRIVLEKGRRPCGEEVGNRREEKGTELTTHTIMQKQLEKIQVGQEAEPPFQPLRENGKGGVSR